MTTFIYGAIEEYGLSLDREKEVYSHNENVIKNLQENDCWPPLSREMFSITKKMNREPGPNLEYYGRIIHFGACLKSVEYEWDEWKEKFEDLLAQLYWLEAYVHFKTEYSTLASFHWKVDLLKWSIKSDKVITPIKKEYWSFKDIENWSKGIDG